MDSSLSVFRKCSCCKIEKSLDDFSPRKDRPFGKNYLCKFCAKEKAAVRRKTVPQPAEQKLAAILRSRKWRKENPAKRNALKAAYKSSLVKATPLWLSKLQKEKIVLFYEQARDCFLVSGEEYAVDHIVPIRGKNVCGLHVPWNLQVLPSDINRRKSNEF